MKLIRLLIVDDQTLMRDGLKTVLSLEKDFEVIGTACNGMEAIHMVEKYIPDVVLLDIRMPEMDGVTCIKNIKRIYPDMKVIMLTTFNDEEYIIEALANGASGYFLKDIEMEKLVQSIRDCAEGKTIIPHDVALKLAEGLSRISTNKKKEFDQVDLDFTERELELSSMMVQGFTNKQISMMIHISEGTVRNYISNIYSKIGLSDRTQAVLYLKEHGMK
jgi:DNA-binding NarL/FixJ family response regulator